MPSDGHLSNSRTTLEENKIAPVKVFHSTVKALEEIKLNLPLSYHIYLVLLDKLKAACKGKKISEMARFSCHETYKDFIRDVGAAMTETFMGYVLISKNLVSKTMKESATSNTPALYADRKSVCTLPQFSIYSARITIAAHSVMNKGAAATLPVFIATEAKCEATDTHVTARTIGSVHDQEIDVIMVGTGTDPRAAKTRRFHDMSADLLLMNSLIIRQKKMNKQCTLTLT